MKRVLLTGARGFIGHRTIGRLMALGYEVHAVTSKPDVRDTASVHWHEADLLDVTRMAQVLRTVRPTHLLHLAWYAAPGKFWRSLENYRWLEAGITLMRHFHEQGGTRIVMAGTCAEYDWDHGFCSEAVTPRRPVTPYGVCKNALQEALHSFAAEVGMSSAWGRVFFLYGPGEHKARLMASAINALLRGEAARCTHGNQIRDFLHVQDVADAFVALLESSVGGAVNIASGQPRTLREVVLAAADCIGAGSRVEFGSILAPEGDPPLLVADVRRLQNEVLWTPHYDLRSGVEDTVQYWRSRNGKI